MTELPCQYVVINYNAGACLRPAVESILNDLLSATMSSEHQVGVVVVDNGSTDTSLDSIQGMDGVLVIRQENMGYAAGANRGIAATTAPIVVVCNPDLVVHHGATTAILSAFDADPKLAAVGPKVLNPDGSVYPSIRKQPALIDAVGHGIFGMVWKQNPFTRRYRQLDRDPSVACDADWVSGAAIWLRRSALEAIGGWDDGYFMYVEDVDLCWRLHRAGFAVRYDPNASVTHVQGVSTSTRPTEMLRAHHDSLWRFAKKRLTGPKALLLPLAWVFLRLRSRAAIVDSRRNGRRSAPRLGE